MPWGADVGGSAPAFPSPTRLQLLVPPSIPAATCFCPRTSSPGLHLGLGGEAALQISTPHNSHFRPRPTGTELLIAAGGDRRGKELTVRGLEGQNSRRRVSVCPAVPVHLGPPCLLASPLCAVLTTAFLTYSVGKELWVCLFCHRQGQWGRQT